MANETPAKRMSADDIISELNAIAADGGNRDQFKALKLLSGLSGGGAGVALPPPLTDAEVVARLSRLMTPYGVDLSRAAFRKSFGRLKPEVATRVDPMDLLSPDERTKVAKVQNLSDLHRLMPASKRGGLPRGYPKAGDVLQKQEFCRSLAAEFIVAERTKPATREVANSPTLDDDEEDRSRQDPPARATGA